MSHWEVFQLMPCPYSSDKLKFFNGLAYNQTKVGWSVDPYLLSRISYPNIVNYLIFISSPYTFDYLKSFKFLKDFNQTKDKSRSSLEVLLPKYQEVVCLHIKPLNFQLPKVFQGLENLQQDNGRSADLDFLGNLQPEVH